MKRDFTVPSLEEPAPLTYSRDVSTALAVSKGKYNTGVAQHCLGVTDFPFSLPFSQARTAQSSFLSPEGETALGCK